MNARKIVIDTEATLGPPPYWLCEVKEDREYINNRPTDKILGYKYITAIPNLGLDKLSVKIPGPQQIALSNDELEGVAFENLSLSVYGTDNKQVGLSAKATRITVFPEKK